MNVNNLISLLEEMAELLELDGANSFKVSAHSKAARALGDVGSDIEAYIQEGRIQDIPGVGKGLAAKIQEYHDAGRISELEELRERIPTGLIQMTRVPGLGPKKAKQIYEELNVESVEALQRACEQGAVAELKGMGAKTAEKILRGIEQYTRYSGNHRLDTARRAALPFLEELRRHDKVERVEIAGSLRRWKETVHDLDFVAATRSPGLVMDYFATLPGVASIIAKGETKTSVMLRGNIQADLRCVTGDQFPYALMHFTGSKEHNTRMRGRAKEYGLKLNEYGLFPEGKKKSKPAKDEAEIYGHVDLAYIPPEMREDMGEMEAAEENRLPSLIRREDLRGVLHMHTKYSDGKPEVEDYAKWAKQNGVEWMGISDHSQSLKIANGLSVDRLREQWEEIDKVNELYGNKGVRILKSVECDILPDGSLDYPDEILSQLDFLIVSVHTHFNLSEEDQTQRVCRALENPHVTLLGHMTGRLLLSRDPYAMDQKAVIRKAAEEGVAIEINANPRRLDIDWRLIRFATDLGVRIAISPDAHIIEGLDDIDYGVAIGRKGWLTRDQLLNALSADEFLSFAKSRKKG